MFALLVIDTLAAIMRHLIEKHLFRMLAKLMNVMLTLRVNNANVLSHKRGESYITYD
jgi:hypothetical protein